MYYDYETYNNYLYVLIENYKLLLNILRKFNVPIIIYIPTQISHQTK